MPPMHDLKNRLALVQLMDPQDTNDNDDQLSNILDTANFGSAVVAVMIGAITGIAAGHDLIPVLQESDTTVDGDFTAVVAADVEGAFTEVDAATEDQAVQWVGYKGSKRYVRVKLDYTGTDITAALIAILGILGEATVLPAVAPAAVTAT